MKTLAQCASADLQAASLTLYLNLAHYEVKGKTNPRSAQLLSDASSTWSLHNWLDEILSHFISWMAAYFTAEDVEGSGRRHDITDQ